MGVEWSRPRQIHLAGRRKATERYCNDCEKWHRTQRHAEGEEFCKALKASRTEEVPPFHIRMVPRTAG